MRVEITLYSHTIESLRGIALPHFEHDGRSIFYVDVNLCGTRSAGVPLVLVHGAGSSHLVWALTIRDFSATNRMIALDLSGHGKSDALPGPASIRNYASEVAALIAHLELGDHILVGHSMGGAVAMLHALETSARVPSGLVLVDTAPRLDLSRILPGLLKEAIDDRLGNISLEDNPDAATIRRHEAQFITTHPGVMQRDLAACSGFDISERMDELKMPAFVLVGEHDDIISPKIASELTQALPRADIAVVKGAHHVPMLEAAPLFNDLLRKFSGWLARELP